MYSEIFFEKIFFEIFEIFEKNLKIFLGGFCFFWDLVGSNLGVLGDYRGISEGLEANRPGYAVVGPRDPFLKGPLALLNAGNPDLR